MTWSKPKYSANSSSEELNSWLAGLSVKMMVMMSPATNFSPSVSPLPKASLSQIERVSKTTYGVAIVDYGLTG